MTREREGGRENHTFLCNSKRARRPSSHLPDVFQPGQLLWLPRLLTVPPQSQPPVLLPPQHIHTAITAENRVVLPSTQTHVLVSTVCSFGLVLDPGLPQTLRLVPNQDVTGAKLAVVIQPPDVDPSVLRQRERVVVSAEDVAELGFRESSLFSEVDILGIEQKADSFPSAARAEVLGNATQLSLFTTTERKHVALVGEDDHVITAGRNLDGFVERGGVD